MGGKPRPNTIAIAGCETLLANALVAARNQGHTIVAGHCRLCGASTSRKTCCLLCALMLYRDQPTGDGLMESRASKILGVEERYVLDIVSGFDNDGDVVENRDARSLGRKLRRKYL